ncbi:LCP family protein [Sellimonas caecigallum]|uniref:LytR family transcriptional regulator n=1 Tax=Sellimonas caecigallum TaxID=2592333 RepID=A0ABS7L878_9FIRM|nr:LCP family protein [Sellimonas caecigallum]MBY0759259.1 LytR family transcriptional regulator [Sellimonas caecigallum]
MAQRENGNNRREEYRRIRSQQSKARGGGRRQSDPDYNLEERQKYRKKSFKKAEDMQDTEGNIRQTRPKADRAKAGRRKERKAERAGIARGMVFFAIQMLASFALMGVLCWLDILIMKYLLIIAGVLLLLLGITLVSQLAVRGKAKIIGKVFSLLVSVTLIIGSFYLYKTGGALLHMTRGTTEIHKMVVVVRENDKAQELSDVSDYTFGVEYARNVSNTERTIENVNKELKKHIATKKYDEMGTLAKALIDEEIDVIIYDSNYNDVMNQAVEGFTEKTRILYRYNIEENTQDTTLNVPVQSEPFSVYLSGIDTYGDVATQSRSDVNIIATVNPKSRQILLVTTPRDYYVPIPGISGGMPDKLTHAGQYGVDVSIDTLEELYQVEIPFYARLNFTSFVNIIDILGGVDVNSELAFTTGTDAGAIVEIKQGINHLDGKEALAFARERHALDDGDNQRGKNQEALITAIIQKMIAPSMIVKATDILAEMSDSVETNMSMKQIRALIKQQLQNGSDWQIYSVAADGMPDRRECYSIAGTPYVTVPNEETVAQIGGLINRVEAGEILEGSVKAEGK